MDGQSKSKYPQAISSCFSPICLEQDPRTDCCCVLSKQCMICILPILLAAVSVVLSLVGGWPVRRVCGRWIFGICHAGWEPLVLQSRTSGYSFRGTFH